MIARLPEAEPEVEANARPMVRGLLVLRMAKDLSAY